MPRLNNGDILRSADDEYRIINYLGEGLTARVYKAERITANSNGSDYPAGSLVALKVLQEGLPDDIQRNFRDEADLIARLSHAERSAGLTKSLIPGLVERATGSDVAQEFLAMEFVSGAPLDQRVREEGPLDEQMALGITAQVLTILELLHTQLYKTYTDFQLQNIWILPGESNIKVMDWNHVSRVANPLPHEWVDADLRRMGAYLYQILTGKGASQTGETGYSLAARAGEHWTKISIGTRNIVRRAIDPDESRRFPDTAAFKQAVAEQLRLWQANIDDVVDEAQGYMRPVTKAYAEGMPLGQADLEKAEAYVDMAMRLSPDDRLVRNWFETIQRVTQEVSGAWGSGRQLLKARQYREAVAIWRAEAASWGRPDLWRRVMIAQAAVELGEATYLPMAQALEDIVERMNREEWPDALDLFAALPSASLSSDALTSLRREIDAQLSYLNARTAYEDQRWADAARGFREIETALSAIAYADILRKTIGWDKLGELANESERLAQEEQRSDERTSELARDLTDNPEYGLSKIKVALQEQPKSPAIIGLLEKEAKGRSPAEAFDLLAVAQAYGVMPTDQETRIRRALAAARSRARIDEALDSKRWHELALLVVDDPDAWPSSASADVFTAFDNAASGANIKLTDEIAALLDVIDPQGVDGRRQKMKEQRERQQEATATWVTSLPSQVEALVRVGRYQEAKTLIIDAQPFVREDATINALLSAIEPRLDEYESIRTGLREVDNELAVGAIDPEGARSLIRGLKGRIETLPSSSSPGLSTHLMDKARSMESRIAIDEVRSGLENVDELITQHRYSEASAKLDRVEIALADVLNSHPQYSVLTTRLEEFRAQLNKEKNDDDGRTWLEANAKLLLGVSGLLLVLLVAGAIGLSLVVAKRGEQLTQTQSSLVTAEARYAESQSTINAPTALSLSESMTAQALDFLVAQSTINAYALATYVADSTRGADVNQGLQEALAATQMTPEPMMLVSRLLGGAPVSSTRGEGMPVFYDLPNALVVAPPPGGQFQIAPDQPLRITDGNGTVRDLLLSYGYGDDLTKDRMTVSVPSSAVSEDPQGSGGLLVDLTQISSRLWREPGYYHLNWEAVSDDGVRIEGATPIFFELAPPPRVHLESDRTFRSYPRWSKSYLLTRPTGDVVMEVLGKIDLEDEKAEDGAVPPVPDFLMVRLPGGTTVYWLPSWNAVEYSTPEWQALLDKLPVVEAPPEG